MILQALNDYYERKKDTGELPPSGFQRKEIPFVIVLSNEGKFVHLEDTRTSSEGWSVAKSFLVPQERERSGSRSFEISNILWDHYGYVLGHPKSTSLKDVEMADKQLATFVAACRQLCAQIPNDPDLKAVIAFLDSDEQREKVVADPKWADCSKIPGCNVSFRIVGHNELVCQIDAVKRLIEQNAADEGDDEDDDQEAAEGICLVTGAFGLLARKHPRTPILGVKPSSKSNAKFVSFQKNCGFDSYGRLQSYNAPVGERAAFAYTTALNHLLRKGSSQRLQVGDASTVFWTDGDQCEFENTFAALFGGGGKDDPDRGVQAVRNLLEATKTGVYLPGDKNTRFCVLGLAPNAARIAVRFWRVGPVKEFAQHIAQHFRDIKIDRPTFESEHLPLWRLLGSTALQGKSENVPPDLAGDTMRAILAGLPYPAMLLQAAVRRCRAEQAVTYSRAAAIKASLNRLFRQRKAKELTVSLDKSNVDPGYRLGRLFSALERIQGVAQPGINATIRDRYYGAASSSPSSVFPVLLRLKNHHMSKLEGGLATWFEKLLGEIVSGIAAFPAHLSLQEQGLFAIGYYHQQQDFFTSKSKSTGDVAATQGELQ